MKGNRVFIVVCGLECRVFENKEDAEKYEWSCRGCGPQMYEAIIE